MNRFRRLELSIFSKKCFVQKDWTWEQIEDFAKGGCFEKDAYPGYVTSKAAICLPHLMPLTVVHLNVLALLNWQAYRPREITRVWVAESLKHSWW
jgi:hypothetical protein